MKSAMTTALMAAMLAGGMATAFARDGAQGGGLTLVQSASPQECAALQREELEARGRGDRWRADQLQDEYESECGDGRR
jgi:hypothetical protein